MANVLNRKTLEYRKSVNTPDFPVAQWVGGINPDGTKSAPVDLSALGGVRPSASLHVLEGDTLRDMTAEERGALVSLESMKASRMADTDARTRELIAQGFKYDGQTFSMSDAAQTNLQSMYSGRDRPELVSRLPIPYPYLDSSGELQISSVEIIEAMYVTMNLTKLEILSGGNDVKRACRTAASKSELASVVDARGAD